MVEAGLLELAALEKLTELNLAGTEATDRVLKAITVLKALKSLNVRSTKVTDAGVKNFQKVLPNCKIER